MNIKELKFYTNSNIRESRDKNHKLNYLTGFQKLDEIKNCEVINLKDGKNKLFKIKNLI